MLCRTWWRTITTLGGLFANNDIVVQGEEGSFAKVVRPDVDAGRVSVHACNCIGPKRACRAQYVHAEYYQHAFNGLTLHCALASSTA